MCATEPSDGYEPEDAARQYGDDPRADECGRCNGDGEIGSGSSRQTCPVCRGSALSSAGEAKLATRFQKSSGEPEAGAKLPAEAVIRVRENGDVAGVASGHPEDSSTSPGHRALFFRADPYTLRIEPLDSRSCDVYLEATGPNERIPLGTNRHLNGAATRGEAARLLILTACSWCGPNYPHPGCVAALDGAAFLVGEPSGDINEEQAYAAGRR